MAVDAFFIQTFGCQMNERDSEIMAGLLAKQGLVPAAAPDEAAVMLVNTCHVREHAEQRAASFLGRLRTWRESRPDRVLAFTGCVAEAQGRRILERFPFVDIVLGPAQVMRLPDLVERVRDGFGPEVATGTADAAGVPELTGEHPAGFRAWIKILEGCDHQCTFCVVPAVRGKERSREFEEIVAEAESLAARGVHEVTLLGQTVNAYGKRAGPDRDFAALLRRLDRVPGLARLRFTSPHPVHHTESVLTAMAECGKVCEHMHLPVQSGSDRMLRAMWRGYTAAGYLRIVARARALVPTLAFTTDLIVGFPGETEEDFAATLALVREVKFDNAFAFKYSARPGTPAAALPGQVAEEAKEERLARLNALLEEHALAANEALVGATAEALVEGPRGEQGTWVGRLRSNKLVHFAPDGRVAPGDLAEVRVTGTGNWSLRGELAPLGVSPPPPFPVRYSSHRMAQQAAAWNGAEPALVRIRDMVRRLAEEFKPERVILFGSHARGTAGPDSDVDLLVVLPGDRPSPGRTIDMRMALRGAGLSKDIFVVSSDEFDKQRDVVGSLVHPAHKEGVVLYERRP